MRAPQDVDPRWKIRVTASVLKEFIVRMLAFAVRKIIASGSPTIALGFLLIFISAAS